ncbi:uncharacterized protein LOC111272619 isoform X3 [Varroa jacobsoni]|uniref:uncharacterized protein LOC111272619 isoform X3 n=1 Tax=Varroa jacobsoni TaxID=62625 RepID=UPI000BF4B2E3|nr:uncharacterized protein LOC111272619 isoform X3 [Varroa jacobsoni]
MNMMTAGDVNTFCMHSSGGPIEVEQRGTFSTTYRRSAVDRHLSCQERWFQVSYSRLDLPRWYLTAVSKQFMILCPKINVAECLRKFDIE